MIKIPEYTSTGKSWRVDPKAAAEAIGFPPSAFLTPTPFRAQAATTLVSGVNSFSYSERTREMFGKGMEEEKGNGVREMQRRKEAAAPKAIQKRGKGKGALE